MKYVLDASVALRWLFEEERHENADKLLEKLLESPELFAVPELFSFEVLAVLFRLHPQPLIAYQTAIIPILQGGMFRYPMTEVLARRAFRFKSIGLTGNDACYAALAEELGAVWLTFDIQAYQRVRGEGLAINLFESLPEALK